MSKVNKTKFAILGVLNAIPCSGYDIKKYCDKSISHFWNENFGHIYPVLRQMETEGLITGKEEQMEGKPPRKLYFITPRGREEFIAWLMQPVDYTPVRSELLLKLTFAKNIPRDNIIEKLQRDKELHEKHLTEYRKLEEAYTANKEAQANESYTYLLAGLRFGIYSAEMRIRWAEETIASIQRMQ